MVSRTFFRCGVWTLIAGTALLGTTDSAPVASDLRASEPRTLQCCDVESPKCCDIENPKCCDTAGPQSSVVVSGGPPGVARLRDKWRDSFRSCRDRAGETCDSCRGRGNCCRPHCSDYDCSICGQMQMLHDQNRHNCNILCAHLRGKLAYFTPMGNGGEGVPKFGQYHLVYAADPNYFDPRDGQVYAAEGWGVPMSVPLAPNVRHTMNYSSGMPASRLTPISNVVPPRRY